MRSIYRAAFGTAFMVSLAAAPAEAQWYRWDAGINGGYAWRSGLLTTGDREILVLRNNNNNGIDETLLLTGSNARFRDSWVVGAQVGYWFTPQIGLRANGNYSNPSLTRQRTDLFIVDDDFAFFPGVGLFDRDRDINLWSLSGDLMFRFIQPNATWQGTEWLPYATAGLGAKWIDPRGGATTCIDLDGVGTTRCFPFAVWGVDPDGDVFGRAYALRRNTSLMGLVGLGTDVRFSPNFALRLEVNDRIYQPRIQRLVPTDVVATPFAFLAGDNISRTVHEVTASFGAHVLFGMVQPEVVTVVPAPAPPPPPPPPPAPVEEAITVCVVDLDAPGGLRWQSAVFRPAQGDTLITVNGERVPLRTGIRPVVTARDMDWYIRGQPLAIRVGADRIEYVTYQSAMMIPPERLSFLGTVNGLPVYADRDEVADFITTLDAARRAHPGRDLGDILATDRTLRTHVEGVSFLYVPLDAVGCVFQPLRLMEPVRKGK